MDITKNVMQKIKKGQVRIKPRIIFVAANIALGIGIALSVIIAIISANFLFNRLEERPVFRLAGLGRIGVIQSFMEFPWLFIIVAALFTGIGLFLMTKTDLVRRKSFIPIVIAVVILVIIAGFTFNKTGINRRIRKHPQMGKLYERTPSEIWITGTITEVNEGNIKIQADNRTVLKVISKDNTVFSSGPIRIGNCVRIVGDYDGKVFVANGIFGCPKRYLDQSERNF